MLEEGIVAHIKADSGLATKLDAGGGRHHIYPLLVPDGVTIDKALTYTEIDQSLTYPLVRSSLIQINCIAKTFADARDLANDIDILFNDFNKEKLGGVFWIEYVKFNGRSNFYDADAKLYIFSVELFIKF